MQSFMEPVTFTHPQIVLLWKNYVFGLYASSYRLLFVMTDRRLTAVWSQESSAMPKCKPAASGSHDLRAVIILFNWITPVLLTKYSAPNAGWVSRHTYVINYWPEWAETQKQSIVNLNPLYCSLCWSKQVLRNITLLLLYSSKSAVFSGHPHPGLH